MQTDKESKLGLKGTIQSILWGILMASVFVLVFSLATVQGQSMEPTLQEGDKLLVAKWYTLDYGDIVIAKSQSHQETYYLIKRVIGLPGDTIQFYNNRLYRNGLLIEEPYLFEQMQTADIEVVLGDDEFFLCGDNRNNSLDSRSELEGPFSTEDIFGKILFK